MKKLLALTLALMMALTCVSAFADTIYTKTTVDSEVLSGILTGFGVPEDQQGMVQPIVALINALGVNVVTAEDGCQVDLDLNGENALSLGFAMDEKGAAVVSSLFPNYIVTASQETIDEFMKQMQANMPGASGEGGEAGMPDMNAVMETFGGYYQRWFEACAAAGQPGDPVPGEYEFEGYKFDTKVPVTVDMAAITEATRTLMDEILADPAAMGMIKGFVQNSMKNAGQEFDEADFDAKFKEGFEEWMSHMPVTANAEVYVNEEGGDSFYMQAESIREGEEDPFTAYMLLVDESHMKMGYQDGKTTAGSFYLDGTEMGMDFEMGEMYVGLALSFPEGQFAMGIYFMNAEKPVVTVAVSMDKGGERTLSMDAEGKDAVAVEDILGGESDAMNGLMGDVMMNGMSALGVLTEQVPEVSDLIGMFMSGEAMAG